MLHLVCPSRTPPSSPKPRRSHGNTPRGTSAGSAVRPSHTARTFGFISQNIISQYATAFISFAPVPSNLECPPHWPTQPVLSSSTQRWAQTHKCTCSQPPHVFTADAKVTSPSPLERVIAVMYDPSCSSVGAGCTKNPLLVTPLPVV